jgi:hypothetical protein
MFYNWPIWFADDFSKEPLQGQMVDISSKAAAFTCHAYESHPSSGQRITTHFSVPLSGLGDSFAMRNFVRSGYTYRVDHIGKLLRRVTVQFVELLPFKPGEQTNSEADVAALLKTLS